MSKYFHNYQYLYYCIICHWPSIILMKVKYSQIFSVFIEFGIINNIPIKFIYWWLRYLNYTNHKTNEKIWIYLIIIFNLEKCYGNGTEISIWDTGSAEQKVMNVWWGGVGTKKVLVPHWNQEPRTKIPPKLSVQSWFLVLGSSEVLVPS